MQQSSLEMFWRESALPRVFQQVPKHRYLWHQRQRIPQGKFEERVRAIVREEINKTLPADGLANLQP
jgi:hypothetical protein